MECRGEEGVVFMGVAFRELPGGRSRWRLTQSRDRGLQGSTQCGYCVHGSHLLPTGHDHLDASTTGALRSRHHVGCRVAVERVIPYTLICDGPPKCRALHGHDYRRPASHRKKASQSKPAIDICRAVTSITALTGGSSICGLRKLWPLCHRRRAERPVTGVGRIGCSILALCAKLIME
jgi:hypothetical protein